MDYSITGGHGVLALAEPGKRPLVRVWYQFDDLNDADELPEILESEWSGNREIMPGQVLHCEAEIKLFYIGDYMVTAYAETGRAGRLLQQASRLYFRVGEEGIEVYRCPPDELGKVYRAYTKDFFTPVRIALTMVIMLVLITAVVMIRKKAVSSP